ncbi:MAG: rod shape-determining protein MreD [Lachnospiraceae bacterium]|nr:rod shape-determining protein MreD [Lachnospiraceae bacterium]
MRIIFTAVLLVVNIALQSTLFQLIAIRGVVPNTAIIIIVSVALLRGRFEGLLTGFFAGLLQDIFFGNALFFYALLGMLTGYFCGGINKSFYRENFILPLVLCAAATFLYNMAIYLTSLIMMGNINLLYCFLNKILPETVYTSVLSILGYRLLFELNEMIEYKERFRRKLF